MGYRHILFVFAAGLCVNIAAVSSQRGTKVEGKGLLSRFSCLGRASGYYADTETGCQVYHMCDGLGRQFSYKCPNMTLFQQRMLICDHWYMVNCSMSEKNYKANLLIGQRDKPFVSDDEMRFRTPRPDILSAPPYNPYYDLLRTDFKTPGHSSNSIVGFDDVIGDVDNDLEAANVNYRPPSGWSAGTKHRYGNKIDEKTDVETVTLEEAASQEPDATFQPTPRTNITPSVTAKITPPSIDLIPPVEPTTKVTNTENDSDGRPETTFQFIKRFDPTSSDFPETAMSKSEIINLNDQLPAGQVSSEEERTPRKYKDLSKNLNTFQTDNDKNYGEDSKFNSVNTKASTSAPIETSSAKGIPAPEKVLLPPKSEFSELPSTTVGPPIYYDWKWAVPAFDLIPPKEGDSKKNITGTPQTRSIHSENPFVKVTRPEPKTTTPEPSVVEYNISSYFVPDYVFPLDKEHPGYDNDEAQTSFQVDIERPGKKSYGENPKCPQCHPAYLKPGTCEPCIVKR